MRARVRHVQGRNHQPVHIAIVAPSGAAAFSMWASTAAEARQIAEGTSERS